MVADETGAAVMVTSGGEVTDNLLGEDAKLSELSDEETTGIFLDPLLAKLGSLR